MTPDLATPTTVETPDGPMPAHLWLPPQGSGPGLVMVQEIFGVSDYIRSRCADLAALGYVVVAPEIYWRLSDHRIDESADDVLARAMAVAGQVDWELAVSDVGHALNQLRSMPNVTGGVGLIGFCFGGGLAFNVAALEDPDVLVSYYGSALPDLLPLAERVTAPSLHHFGLSDSFILPETVGRIQETLKTRSNVVFSTYPGANHAFDNPSLAMFYNAEASEAAWRATTAFLADHLRPGRS